MLVISGKLATEDEMPGKLFALIEEILLCLTIYIPSYNVKVDSGKALGLTKLMTDQVIAELVKEKDFGNMIMSVNLMRLVALLQSSFDQ